jgi:heme o synthase
MTSSKTVTDSTSFKLATKVKDYFQLIKFTLSFTVVFSSVACFLIAPYEQIYTRHTLLSVLLLFVGGMCITGSANAINQVWEKDTDALMKRTASRPVASGRMSVTEGYTFAAILAVVGTAIMWYYFNASSALVGLASLFLYGFVYTPLKKVNSIAVLVGAIPGALPCLIGWVAATDNFEVGGWVLFAIQFMWQFPHFWAIAWLAHEDYTTAGFKLLPSKAGPTKFTAVQSVMYSALMIPIGVLPYMLKLTGSVSMWIVLGCNIWMVIASVLLLIKMDRAAARKVMFSSYFYLMIVFLALWADKNVVA